MLIRITRIVVLLALVLGATYFTAYQVEKAYVTGYQDGVDQLDDTWTDVYGYGYNAGFTDGRGLYGRPCDYEQF